MDITGHESRSTEGKSRIAQTRNAIPGIPNIAIIGFAAVAAIGGLIAGARRLNVPVGSVLSQQISTEGALTLYMTTAGIAGFLANLVASSQISTIDGETVAVSKIFPPVAVQIAGAFVGASLFPSGEGGFL